MSFLTEYFDIDDVSGEVAVCCPFPHYTSNGSPYYETHPSAHVNPEKGVFHCKVCNKGYGEHQFIQKVTGCTFPNMLKILKCFDNDETLGEWLSTTSRTSKTNDLLDYYGIDQKVADELHIASSPLEDTGICFPVFMHGHLMDVRTYNPGHKPKCKSRKDCPAGLVIPLDALIEARERQWVILCAGEKDMAVCRSHGFNAITLTGGEGALPIIPEYFRNKRIAICYDNDGAGIQGSQRLADFLSDYTEEIKVVTNFHEICKEEGEDITDFFNKYNKTKKDLIDLLESTSLYKKSDSTNSEAEEDMLITTGLLEASQPINVGRLMRSNIQVVSVSEETYISPSQVLVYKDKEARSWELTKDNAQDLLHLVDNNFKEVQVHQNLNMLVGYMQKENTEIKVMNKTTVFKAYITDLYETSDDISAQPMEYTVYSLNKKLESGKKYLITYKLVPHPYKGQQLICICVDTEQANDTVTNFKVTPEVKENLKLFQSLPGSITDKVNSLTEKVKGIIGYNGNNTLIKSIDLAFNTVLQFNFGSFKDVRGYLDTFIISESRVGKSSTADALRKTYGLGAITSLAGNSATIPGLVGGSNKTTGGYQTRAGVIPQNHKGLIIFEEFGKSDKHISAELTDIRSSNEVRIARVSGTLTMPALVRMITLTNPKTNGEIKSIASYPNGFSILTELVEAAEDIARYDMIVILADRGSNEIDPLWEPEEPLPTEAYRDRIRWIWSRKPEQIMLDHEVANYIISSANDLNKSYECHIKLFGTEAWKKLARLAIAVAGYVVSTDETYENIIVTKDCVDYARQFLIDIYDNPTFKLKEYVQHERLYSTIDDEGVALLQDIYDKNPSMVLQLEQSSQVTRHVLQSATGMTQDDVNKCLNKLTKGLFIKYSAYDIIPTERFRLGVAKINRGTTLRKLGEVDA